MTTIGQFRDRPGELVRKIPALYREAAKQQKTLPQILEQEDPSHEWDNAEDRAAKAWGRVLMASGFRFKSDPTEGLWADTLEDIYEDEVGRALLPEWGRMVWRKARTVGWSPQVSQKEAMHRILGSDESALGSSLRPFVDTANVYYQQLTPGLGLDDLVATTTQISGTDYRRPYLDEPPVSQTRLLRIGEKADIPRATITLSEHTIRLFKYGRGIELSYEASRRVPIDKIGLFIAKSALQVEADRVAQAIDVAINGDGNSGTAATNYNQSTLDTGSAVTVKGFIAFKQKFKPPYALTLLVARETELTNLQLLQLPNQNPFFTQVNQSLGIGGLTPIQDLNGGLVFYAQSDAVAAGVYLGLDTRFALERIVETGSDIQETQRFIERQTEALFFTENDGFGLTDSNANKTWTMA